MEDNYFKYRYSDVLKIGIVKWLLMLYQYSKVTRSTTSHFKGYSLKT